jgi:dGTPase
MAVSSLRIFGQEDSRVNSWQTREQVLLAPYAFFSKQSTGRRYPESLHPYRSPFQRDRDRVLHSAAFRRLSGKMQVFTGDMGDYHRTRLTHTHEVASLARTIGRCLRLNEDLIEALALLHDIGHPPFGHCGEDALNECLIAFAGFSHNRFALKLVEDLEQRYTTHPGLNLTDEVLAGQTHRTEKDKADQGLSPILEVQVVDAADSIAYDAHDVDDAIKLGLINFQQIRSLALVRRALDSVQDVSTQRQNERQLLVHALIDIQIDDFISVNQQRLEELRDFDSKAVREIGMRLCMSSELEVEKKELEKYLFEHVYRHPKLMDVRQRAATRVKQLFKLLVAYPERLPSRFQQRASRFGIEQSVGEYLGGMTDRFCDDTYIQMVELGRDQALDW